MRSHKETMELLARANKQLERVPELAKENAQLKADLLIAQGNAANWLGRFVKLAEVSKTLYRIDWVYAHQEDLVDPDAWRPASKKGVKFWIDLRDALGLPPGQRANKADRATQRAMIAMADAGTTRHDPTQKGVHTPQGFVRRQGIYGAKP